MEGRYPPGLFITLMDCTELSKEDAFNHWYNEIFMPAVGTLEYIRNMRRYKNVMSDSPTFLGRPKYLTLMEVYEENLEQALKAVHRREHEILKEGYGANEYITKVNTMYRRIGPEFRTGRTGEPVKAIYCGLLGCEDPSREEEFNKWYNERHSPETIINNIFSFDTGYRYEVVNPLDPVPHQSSRYLTLYETSADREEALKGLQELRKQSLAQKDILWIELLRVYFAGLYSPMETNH
jgi:hypothetical protein